jgi:hypothetical protein
MSYKRVDPQDLVVGKAYYIVPAARLISNNMKNADYIPESKKKRFLFPEGKLESMKDIPEGSSVSEVYSKKYNGYKLPPSYWSNMYFPSCAFTGLNSNGKPLLNSVKNFICGETMIPAYVFFSTELTD